MRSLNPTVMSLETRTHTTYIPYTPYVPLTIFVPPPEFMRPPAVVYSPVYDMHVLRPYQYERVPKPIPVMVPENEPMKVIYIPRKD